MGRVRRPIGPDDQGAGGQGTGQIEIQTPGTGAAPAKAAAPAALDDKTAPGENTAETSASGVATRSVQTVPVQKDGTIGKAH